jgi:hypothetical protein
MRSAAQLRGLLLLAVAGCVTPTRSALDPDAGRRLELDLVGAQAAADCRARRADAAAPPNPFTSDGCSAWPDAGWVGCCVAHDADYWCGGSAEQRARADRRLRECVAEESGAMGSLMWLGVRAGGAPWAPARWRWGYGWDYPASYTEE